MKRLFRKTRAHSFSNYKAGLGHKNENSGFNLDRAFVGYEGFFAKGFSAKILMNVETVADENGKRNSTDI